MHLLRRINAIRWPLNKRQAKIIAPLVRLSQESEEIRLRTISMSVLTHTEIEVLVRTKQLIDPFSPEGLEGASYDMRMGAEYSKGGPRRVLANANLSLTIEPGEFALLTTLETLLLPLDMIGHNGIMSPWAKAGLVSLFSPQIDPGFHGVLVVPVYNAGDRQIVISKEQKIFTVEFVKTSKPALYGWSERHGRVQRGIDTHITLPSASRFLEASSLRDEIQRNRAEIKSLESNLQAHAKDLTRLEKLLDQNTKIDEMRRNKRSLKVGERSLVVSALALAAAVVALFPESSPLRQWIASIARSPEQAEAATISAVGQRSSATPPSAPASPASK